MIGKPNNISWGTSKPINRVPKSANVTYVNVNEEET